MVKEAQEHEVEDKKRREAIEARNQLESLVFGVQKHFDENKDKIPEGEKGRAGGVAEGRPGGAGAEPRAQGAGGVQDRLRAPAEGVAQDGRGRCTRRPAAPRAPRPATPAGGTDGGGRGRRPGRRHRRRIHRVAQDLATGRCPASEAPLPQRERRRRPGRAVSRRRLDAVPGGAVVRLGPPCVRCWSSCRRSCCLLWRWCGRSWRSSWTSGARKRRPRRLPRSSTPLMLVVGAVRPDGAARARLGADAGHLHGALAAGAHPLVRGDAGAVDDRRLVPGDAPGRSRTASPPRPPATSTCGRRSGRSSAPGCCTASSSSTSSTASWTCSRSGRAGLVAYGGHDRRLPGQLVQLPQGRDPPAALGGRGGAVGGAGHGHHPHRLPAVRLRLRQAHRSLRLGHPLPPGQPGLEGPRHQLPAAPHRPAVVPGAPHAALRDAGRAVPVRAADVPAPGAEVLGACRSWAG